MATRSYTFTDGSTAYGSQVETELNEIFTNITNANISASAAIATSKLELSTGTATATILNNNVFYKGKNAAGTAQELIGLDPDDHIVLGQFKRQGGNSTNWETTGTTNYTTDLWTMCGGSATVPASSNVGVTLPITFSSNPICVATANTTVGGVVATADVGGASSITLTNNNASDRTVSWICFGPVS